MTEQELSKMSKEELLVLAREKNLKYRSKMTKEELIKKLTYDITLPQNRMTEPSDPSHPPVFITKVETVERQKHVEEGAFELPPSYNQTQIVLLVRDPYWIYAYWDFRSEIKERLSASHGGWEKVPLSLRVYNYSRKKTGTNEPEYFDISINHAANNWYIHVGGPNQLYQVDLGYYSPTGEFITLARSNQVTTPRDGISEVVDEEWMIVEEDFRRLYRLAGGGVLGESSIEIVESLLKRLEREVGSGAVSSISSPGKYQAEERRFWLVLDTELIVYGATEPDAKVTIQGRPVKLRPDGTFTLRMALPDGRQVIPVTATSNDGVDSITITPTVTKETH